MLRTPVLRWSLLMALLLTAATYCVAQDAAAPPATAAATTAPADAPEPAKADTGAPKPALPGDKTLTLWQIIQWGGTVGYIIILLSVASIMLIIHHALTIRKKTICPDSTREKVAGLIREKKVREAVEVANNDNTLLGRVLSIGFSRVHGGYGEMERVMNDAAEDEAMRMEQSVGYFALLANVAPLLGLLGTIVGMVFAFDKIAKDPAGAASPAKLAEPIEMALVTTVMGLIVAIPCVVAFSWFRNRMHRLLADTALVVEDLMQPFRNLKPGQVKPITVKASEPTPEAKAEGDEPPTGGVEQPQQTP